MVGKVHGLNSCRGVMSFAIPRSRLVSAYVNKYQNTCKQSRDCFRQKYLPNLAVSDAEVSFHEMVATIAAFADFPRLDIHLRPMVGQSS